MESGLILIPILILVSGAVAYIGNLVGRATGRRRLSIFGLRPRYTAHIITVLTGMLITIISLASVLLVSKDARVALFQLNELREQIADAEARLREVKGGDIAYLRNQEVLREVVDGRLPQAQILERLDAMRLRAVDLAVANGIAPDLITGGVLTLDPPNLTWEAAARLVALRRRETVVRIVSLENTLRGEALRVSLLLMDRVLVYPKGTVLFSASIDPRAGREAVGRYLLALVDAAAERAQGRLLSPPFARVTETPRGQLDVDHHRAAIAEIMAIGREVRVDATAQRDITTEMPLVVRFVIHR
ncbi:MAG: DUF3084 domain-containing protein [Armatimonadota bacterium]|nr:DUF3084 domain-containing protein [Armatimonadota bacterium]MDR7549410.1 DUF3084 domain-containing protein [Armatimonadota bacterium]